MKIIDASDIEVPPYLQDYARQLSEREDRIGDPVELAALSSEEDISPEMIECIRTGPRSINDLNDGVSLETYDFTANNSSKLSMLGFVNVDFKDLTKISVVEYAQIGTHICGSKRLTFGIGARMMMKITRTERGAKLDTPHQVAASVIFGKASVRYSLRTFGIVGPGMESLIGSGQLAEDTYTKFVKDIGSIISSAYGDESKFKTTPQPMFLR